MPGMYPAIARQITQRQFAELVYRETGHPVKVGGMGKAMMTVGGLFIPAAREAVEMLYEFEKPFVVDSTRFEQTFGVKATPLADSDQGDRSLVSGASARPVLITAGSSLQESKYCSCQIGCISFANASSYSMSPAA